MTAKAAPARPAGISRMRRREAALGYLFAAPWIIGLFIFTLYPMLSSLYYSFTSYNLAKPPSWVGLGNYRVFFLSDALIPTAAYNTLYYAMFSVPLNMVMGILVALLMNQRVRFINFIRTVYYLPNVVSIVAVSLLWQWIFQGSHGLLNNALALIGINGPGWLTDPAWSKPALIIMSCWNAGGAMVIYLAGLQGIPRTYYEAAEIDGARPLRRFFSITLPLLSPSIFFNLVMGIIGALQVFSQAFIMTSGGPLKSTTFYVYALYQNAFTNMRMGYASAMAWILLVVTLLLTLMVFRLVGSRVHYESEG